MIRICLEENRAAAYDGEKTVGECCFVREGSAWILNHTQVDSEYGGLGIARSLLKEVVRAAAEENVKIRPACSFVAREFEKNPEEYRSVMI